MKSAAMETLKMVHGKDQRVHGKDQRVHGKDHARIFRTDFTCGPFPWMGKFVDEPENKYGKIPDRLEDSAIEKI